MASSITVIVRDDPRTSHRPVEALRIALGWTRVMMLDNGESGSENQQLHGLMHEVLGRLESHDLVPSKEEAY